MRLTTILLIALCMHLSAGAQTQQVTLSERHTPLVKIFKKITDQTGYLFVYRDEWLKQTHDVTISVRKVSLKTALDICFADQPFIYEVIDKMVVLKERPPATATPSVGGEPAQPMVIDVRGRVADSMGIPLEGASIRIKGTGGGAQADVRGEFELKNINPGTVLVVSYTGFVSKEVRVPDESGYHNIMLQRSQDELDAMMIQAYGTTSRRMNIGSISTVDASTIEKQPVTNPLLALEGQVAGLAINATTGVPGSTVLVQIRGQNTMQNNPGGTGATNALVPQLPLKPYDQPLFIIDGVPFAPQNSNVSQLNNLAGQEQTTGGLSQFTGISPFASINPADIESITVLRDADATSIYGTQGSNGVILITTKKGKAGKTAFSLNANTGFNTTARPIQLMNTQQYLNLRHTAFAQDSIAPSSDPNTGMYGQGYAPDLSFFSQTKYTDWEKIIYGNTTNVTDIHASLSGGTNNNTFLLSGGYTRSTFNYPGDFSDQRMTMHSNVHHTSMDNRLSLDFVVDFGYDQNYSAGLGGNKDILLPPNMPNLVNPDGSLLWNYEGVDLQQYQFYANLLMTDRLQTYNLNNSLHLTYKILPGLSATVSAGYNRNTSNEASKDPSTAQEPPYFNRNATFAQTDFQTINLEPQLDYNRNFGKSVLSVLVGGTYKKNSTYTESLQGNSYSNDQLLGSIDGAGQVTDYSYATLYKYDAAFGRIKYIYNQEFIVSLTGRRDGSSNFGPGRQFGSFGSAGGGWIFTQEKAVKNAIPFLSYGKIYGSYGTSGSDGIAPYMYQPYWQARGGGTAFQGVTPDYPLNLSNPDYSWATKKSTNIALDLGFFHDRLLVNATYYLDREANQLGGYPLPATAGISSVTENLPADIQNKGLEFSATSANIKGRKFSWNSNFNISFNRNKLLRFPNLETSPYNQLYAIGQPTSLVFGVRYKDVNPTTGLFEFYDAKGQPTSNPNFTTIANGGDMSPIANEQVKYMGGLGNTLNYKNFSLYLFFQFSSMTAPNYLYTMYSQYYPGFMVNQPAFIQGKYWTGPGDANATLQRLSTGYGSPSWGTAGDISASNAAFTDDTYIRLKTVSLSYSLPNSLMKHLRMSGARVFCNAQNLLTLTDYKVGDPETGLGNYTNFPLQRTVVFGLNCNF